MSLAPVIDVDSDRCVNCHMCISVCPVKMCIDGSGDVVEIDHDRCIGCGHCIPACTHDARSWSDDLTRFLDATQRGDRIVAIVAPAVAATFPERHLHFNGFLRSLGVQAVFDVSFGAELTVKSYVEHIQRRSPRIVIAQPCPAIVNYVELYQPELIPHLAPADSPMVHTMKMVRAYYPQYAGARFAVISPCLAKRREFDETGFGDYNVTFRSLARYMIDQRIDLERFAPREYDNPPAERAVLFSSPGGLLRTAQRDVPGIEERTRKVEGVDHVYDYMKKLPALIASGRQPLLVDCLNCALGCNGGPGTPNQGKSPDEIEYPVEARRRDSQAHLKTTRSERRARKTVRRLVDAHWEPGLYERSYVDRSATAVTRRPSRADLNEIYARMLKTETADHLNCAACGYNSCEMMAIAIYNGLNKPENCHHYRRQIIQQESSDLANHYERLHREIDTCQASVAEIGGRVGTLQESIRTQAKSLAASGSAIEQLTASITNVAGISTEKRDSIAGLADQANGSERQMGRMSDAVTEIAATVDTIAQMVVVINDIADRTNLLSMNAAIEAAHAGDSGAGFAVVAAEIRHLARETSANATSVSETLQGILRSSRESQFVVGETGDTIRAMAGDIRVVANSMEEVLSQTVEMSGGSRQILDALADLRDANVQVESISTDVESLTSRIGESMVTLLALSEENFAHFTELTGGLIKERRS